MRELAAGALLAVLALGAGEGPRLGRPLPAAEAARMDLSIPPDGAGLPPGRGSVAEGQAVYEQQCLACHGPAGAGGPMDRLTGGVGSLGTARPIKTVASYWPYATTVFDYIRRAMPLQAPQSLTSDQVYAVTAYLLSVDGIVPPTATLDARSLPAVRMPNRDGFVSAVAEAR